jgi:hypothetical protein
MSKFALWRSRKPAASAHRRTAPAPVTTAPAGGAALPSLPEGCMPQRPGPGDTLENEPLPPATPPSARRYSDPDALGNVTPLVTNDGQTAVIKAVEKTAVMAKVPAPKTAPPDTWSPPFRPATDDDWTPVTRRVKRSTLNELPATEPKYDGECSYQSLKGYTGPVHEAAVNAPWFRPSYRDETPRELSLQLFFDRWGVLPKAHDGSRASGCLDTEIFALRYTGQFSTTSEGRNAA